MAKLIWGIISFAVFCIFCANYVAAQDYYPLEKGIRWKYNTERIFSFEGDGATKTYTYEVKCLGKTQIDKKDVFILVYESGYMNYLIKDKAGVAYYAYQRTGESKHMYYEPPVQILRYPLDKSLQWGIQNKIWYMKEGPLVYSNYAIDSLDKSVIVPAGRYDNCLYIRKLGTKQYETTDMSGLYKFTWKLTAEAYHWYAPEIGWIKGIEEVSINMIDAFHLKKKIRVPLEELSAPERFKNRKIKSVTVLISRTSD